MIFLHSAVRPHPDLAEAEARIAARGGGLGRPLHLLVETTSTNDEAKRALSSGAPHGATWVAEVQTAGRGRQGRVWHAAAGESLLASVVVRVPCSLQRLPELSLVAGLAVRDAIAKASDRPDDVRIKWPNDVVVLEHPSGTLRKIAGVLVESSLSGDRVTALVVGFGINVHARVFPAEVADTASSVALVASNPPHRGELLADVLANLDRDIEHVAARGLGLVLGRLSKADALTGRTVTSHRGQGTAVGIAKDGRLLVRDQAGITSAWNSGEVHIGLERASSVTE
jgi:BirA family biotin operon repressor/biotin-[acetyl-CoA-carboxylase] ligase